ncbi:hypothetical protein BJ508DRAFT_324550 [Ascobolus immersus RN42]|uniref:Phorbol-ester/DAG-type domain-containing protein n=1 Tax=Ascobolus immersus RN42 TaxID=1160509 RepID=A0A3N4IBQ3_ASCIM|nr:hypothetical protein BJ508DRAFT_324550 [Ascobolus immersus RN42]
MAQHVSAFGKRLRTEKEPSEPESSIVSGKPERARPRIEEGDAGPLEPLLVEGATTTEDRILRWRRDSINHRLSSPEQQIVNYDEAGSTDSDMWERESASSNLAKVEEVDSDDEVAASGFKEGKKHETQSYGNVLDKVEVKRRQDFLEGKPEPPPGLDQDFDVMYYTVFGVARLCHHAIREVKSSSEDLMHLCICLEAVEGRKQNVYGVNFDTLCPTFWERVKTETRKEELKRHFYSYGSEAPVLCVACQRNIDWDLKDRHCLLCKSMMHRKCYDNCEGDLEWFRKRVEHKINEAWYPQLSLEDQKKLGGIDMKEGTAPLATRSKNPNIVSGQALLYNSMSQAKSTASASDASQHSES